MNPLQRRLVIVLATFGDNGATAMQLEELADLSQMKVYKEFRILASMGMIVVFYKQRAGLPQVAAKLTDTAKGLLPRLKELA